MQVSDKALIQAMLKQLYVSERLIEDTAEALGMDAQEVLERITRIMAEQKEQAFRTEVDAKLPHLVIGYWYIQGHLPKPIEARIRELNVRDLKVHPHPGLNQLQRLVVFMAHPSQQKNLNDIATIHRLLRGHSDVKVVHHDVVQMPCC